MKRYFVILSAMLMLLAGTIAASASVNHPARTTGTTWPAAYSVANEFRHPPGTAIAYLRRQMLAATHIAHVAHTAHLGHLATIAAEAAAARANALAAITPVQTAAPAPVSDGDSLPPGGAYCKPDCWGDGDGDGFDLSHSPFSSAPAATAQSAPVKTTPAQTGGSYGHPYFCGDGDGDGWDVVCSSRSISASATPATSTGSMTVSAPASSAPVPSAPVPSASISSGGSYSYAGLENLWTSAGGPSWAAAHAASIAECESGGRANAYNPSGATGIWQILGAVSPGNLNNPQVNATNAVSKFNASGQTFAQWVCQ